MANESELSADDDASRSSLPFDDATIDALGPDARERIGEVWRKRAASELVVGSQFELIRRGFERLRPSPALDAALARAVADETSHSNLCARVAERYAGVVTTPDTSAAEPLARFGDADEEVSLVLHLVLVSSVNEVTSTFYLRDAMQSSRGKLARAVLRQLLSDDVEHARIGWAYLASTAVTTDTKRHVGRALPTLLRLSHEAWTDVRLNEEPWFRDHGCPGLAVARSAFERAVPDVILPGMATVGVAAESGARWFAQNVAER